MFPASVSTSFVATYAGLRVNFGSLRISNAPTAAGSANIDIVTSTESLDLGVKLTDWLGVFATGVVRALIGSNLRALTYAGATYLVDTRGGAIVRLFRSDRTGTQLSMSARGSYSNGQVATLLPLFDQPLLSARAVLAGDLGSAVTTPFSTVGVDGALTFAQSFGRWFGLQAAAGLGGGWFRSEPYDLRQHTRGEATESSVTFSFGIAPSLDLRPVKVPITIMPEYSLTRAAFSAPVLASSVFDTIHIIDVGAYPSGRENLQLGVIGSTELGWPTRTRTRTGTGSSTTPS